MEKSRWTTRSSDRKIQICSESLETSRCDPSVPVIVVWCAPIDSDSTAPHSVYFKLLRGSVNWAASRGSWASDEPSKAPILSVSNGLHNRFYFRLLVCSGSKQPEFSNRFRCAVRYGGAKLSEAISGRSLLASWSRQTVTPPPTQIDACKLH